MSDTDEAAARIAQLEHELEGEQRARAIAEERIEALEAALRVAEDELDTLIAFDARRGPDESGVGSSTEHALADVRAALGAAKEAQP